jgi:hypothetical protein
VSLPGAASDASAAPHATVRLWDKSALLYRSMNVDCIVVKGGRTDLRASSIRSSPGGVARMAWCVAWGMMIRSRWVLLAWQPNCSHRHTHTHAHTLPASAHKQPTSAWVLGGVGWGVGCGVSYQLAAHPRHVDQIAHQVQAPRHYHVSSRLSYRRHRGGTPNQSGASLSSFLHPPGLRPVINKKQQEETIVA